MLTTRMAGEASEARARSAAPRREGRAPGGGAARVGPAAVLHLQSTAGNGGVTSLVRGEPRVVQRGLFDALGNLFGGAGGGGLQQQLAGLAGSAAQSGLGSLSQTIGGPFGEILGGAAPGLSSAASSFVGGDVSGALSTLQSTGSAAAGPAAQTAMGMLGNAIGGSAGSLVGGLGSSVGEGLSSVISGGNVAQAGMGVLNAAQPGLMGLASRFLGGI
ncbi:MAG: hypothetical protein ABR613_11250 [Actinomycetota bacterium]